MVVDVVNLSDKSWNVMTIGFVLLTLAILLWYGGGYCWLTLSCQRRVRQRCGTEGGRGLWLVGVCYSRPDLLTRLVGSQA